MSRLKMRVAVHLILEISFYELNKFPNNVIPYVKEAIENYRNNIQFVDYGF